MPKTYFPLSVNSKLMFRVLQEEDQKLNAIDVLLQEEDQKLHDMDGLLQEKDQVQQIVICQSNSRTTIFSNKEYNISNL